MSTMGVGTNILGYSNKEVDQAVQRVVKDGNLSSFNSPEEIILAEKLIEIHPWAEMVRFTRTGGEANSVAIRIARASTSKHNVAFCGYHGWHDWYLASNLSDSKGLDGHLLPGLDPYGVPQNLKGSVYPFEYNNFDKLDISVINNIIYNGQFFIPEDDNIQYYSVPKTKKKLGSLDDADPCLLYTSPSPRDKRQCRMPSSA